MIVDIVLLLNIIILVFFLKSNNGYNLSVYNTHILYVVLMKKEKDKKTK